MTQLPSSIRHISNNIAIPANADLGGYLLVHVEYRQIIVNHEQGINIIVCHISLLAESIPPVGYVCGVITVSYYRKDIWSFQPCFLDELADNKRCRGGVVGKYRPDFIGLIIQLPSLSACGMLTGSGDKARAT